MNFDRPVLRVVLTEAALNQILLHKDQAHSGLCTEQLNAMSPRQVSTISELL